MLYEQVSGVFRKHQHITTARIRRNDHKQRDRGLSVKGTSLKEKKTIKEVNKSSQSTEESQIPILSKPIPINKPSKVIFTKQVFPQTKPAHLLGMSMLMLAATVLPGRSGSRPDVRRSAADDLIVADVRRGVRVRVALGAAARLVDFERIDAPVGLGEGGGVVLDVGVAGAGLGGTAAG